VCRSNEWELKQDCAGDSLVCSAELGRCASCRPKERICDGADVKLCADDGEGFQKLETCDAEAGDACRSGQCLNLCQSAATRRSNVGCEYWAADLDNARSSTISDGVRRMLNAAAQQFAIVVSNPDSEIATTVIVEQDDAAPGEPADVREVARATLAPFALNVFKLGPREIDGSPPGTYDTGTGTAWTRNAYRVRSSAPIVAYQFNPLENADVFSNDASLLKPTEALVPITPGLAPVYAVLGWPQTIAITDDPRTNFGVNLRAFLTLIGTRANTHVRLTSSTRIIAGGPFAETQPGEVLDFELGPFDVVNLETADFNADFTGTLIETDGAVTVFAGSEASNAPNFETLSDYPCCADHLEEQLDPLRTAGKSYIASVSPNRGAALVAAGALLDVFPQPEYFRLIAATPAGARVQTTLPGDWTHFELEGLGSWVELTSTEAFAIESDAPVLLESISPSQDAANIPRGLPGGDPSTLMVPSLEQFRRDYVFLTPDKYSFDFVRILAPAGARIVFDGQPLEDMPGCTLSAIPTPNASAASQASAADQLAQKWSLINCQLSFPKIFPNQLPPDNLRPGEQNDGVHRLSADRPVGVLVDGFDAYVSYAYAGGTELDFIVPE